METKGQGVSEIRVGDYELRKRDGQVLELRSSISEGKHTCAVGECVEESGGMA